MESTGWLFSPLFPGRIGIWKCWFLRREENRSTRRKTLGAGTRTNNKLNPHLTPSPGIEPSHIGGRPAREANAQPLRHPCWRCAFFCLFVCLFANFQIERDDRPGSICQSVREGNCRDGTVVTALASHQCGPGSFPGLGIICGLSLLLVLVLAFFSGYSSNNSKFKFDLQSVPN